MDAGIAKREDYDVYKSGLEKNVYISAPNSDEPFVGTVWPGDSVYPDWFNPNTTSWWHDAMSDPPTAQEDVLHRLLKNYGQTE